MRRTIPSPSFLQICLGLIVFGVKPALAGWPDAQIDRWVLEAIAPDPAPPSTDRIVVLRKPVHLRKPDHVREVPTELVHLHRPREPLVLSPLPANPSVPAVLAPPPPPDRAAATPPKERAPELQPQPQQPPQPQPQSPPKTAAALPPRRNETIPAQPPEVSPKDKQNGQQLALADPRVQPPHLGLLPGQDRPLPEASPPPHLDFTIQAPRRSPVPRAVEELMFEVKDIKVAGVTAYTEEQIRALTQPLIGKTTHLAELMALAEVIEKKYHDDGYILSSAYIPTQDVADGIFQIAVIEGYVAAVAANGGDQATRDRLDQLLEPVLASKPLALPIIERALLSANEIPGISVSGLLRPSASGRGASDLVLTVKEAPLAASVSFDNSGSKSSNPWTIAADASARSPLGDGGLISLSGSAAPDVVQRSSLSARYVTAALLPEVNTSFSALVSHGQPTGSLAQLKLVSDSTAFGSRASYNLLISRDDKLTADAGLTVQSANVRILDAPFSHDEWRVADLALSYQNSKYLDGITSITASVAQGLPFLGASTSGSPTLSRPGIGQTDFTKLSSVLRRTQPIGSGFSLYAAANGQYALNPLLSGEEISFGGPGVGRGYDPGSITGDQGVGGSLELRYDLDAADFYADWLQLYGFYDSAVTWVRVGHSVDNRLRSAGLGLHSLYFNNYSLNLEFGHVIDALPSNDRDHHSSRLVLSGSVKY